jgi:hypothetical protein
MSEEQICTNLYNEGIITYDKYLECIGNSISVRTANMSDMHKYAFTSDNLSNVNIYDKEVNIYSNKSIEQQYLSVINTNKKDLLTITTGIFNKDDIIFIIEKTSDTLVSIKNKRSNKYISYNIPNKKIELSNERNNTTNFIMQTFIISGILQYKFILLKKDGSQTDFSLIIKDGQLSIEQNSNFSWNILAIEYSDISDLDLLLTEINDIQHNYTNALQNYNFLFNKKLALEYIINNINNNINNIFELLKTLQSNSKIQISDTQLLVSLQDTKTILNENKIIQLQNEIESLTSEIAVSKGDLQIFKEQLKQKIEKIDEYISTRNNEININNQKIQNYNQILQNNNIVIDINKFINADENNANEILKSKINREVSNTFNNKKTRINAFYMIIIVILSLIIIIQLTSKLLGIKKYT